MIKSRPIYEILHRDPAGRAHLIVTDLEAVPTEALAPGEFAQVESWAVKVTAPGIAAPAAPETRWFRATADLLSHLRHRLTREVAGFRLYAAGTEAFLWDAHNIAVAAGLGQGEIYLAQAGSLKRRVYCTHCKTMNEDVTTNIVPCRACGAVLFVRDHFSRRLAAFMGVKVDAEVPGEIPAVEVIYA